MRSGKFRAADKSRTVILQGTYPRSSTTWGTKRMLLCIAMTHSYVGCVNKWKYTSQREIYIAISYYRMYEIGIYHSGPLREREGHGDTETEREILLLFSHVAERCDCWNTSLKDFLPPTPQREEKKSVSSTRWPKGKELTFVGLKRSFRLRNRKNASRTIHKLTKSIYLFIHSLQRGPSSS